MPISKTGFTLIEILVVVVILGITASMALMAFGDFGESHRVEASAERFTQKLRVIRHRAILEAIPYRIQFSPVSYQTFQWVSPTQWKMIDTVQLPYLIKAPVGEHIVVQTSGEITPFTLYFGLPKKPSIAEVTAEGNGLVTFKKISSH